MNYPHPGGRAWGGNWVTICMGAIHPISCQFRKTILLVFLSLSAHAAGHLLSAEQKVGKDSPKRRSPSLVSPPRGSSLHSISKGWKKVENRRLSQLFYATDASLAFVFVNKSSAVTRRADPLLCGLWVLSARINYGELKLVSILIRDAVLLR